MSQLIEGQITENRQIYHHYKFVIELSGVQFGLKWYSWFQNRTSAQRKVLYSFFNRGKDNLLTIEAQIFQEISGVMLKRHKKGKKKRWNTTYSTFRFRIARKVPFSIFCKLQPIMELQKLYEKDKKTDKIFKGWYWLIEECTVKISRSNQKNRAGHAFISFQYASLSGQN